MSSTEVEHRYAGYDEQEDYDLWGSRWRWICTCKRKGQWNGQSKGACYTAWQEHAERARKKKVKEIVAANKAALANQPPNLLAGP